LKLLCLSNGHGEDRIAASILRELQSYPNCPQLAALPLVGEGRAYAQLPDVAIVGPVRQMPSGGFVYMDGRQFWRDVRGGWIQLTLAQIGAVKRWVKKGGKVLAVGDIVPLLFAWWSGASYSFVGTAKSEYYLRDEAGWLRRRTRFERLESWSGSVYLPWERALMRDRRCKAVFARDSLTAEVLQKFRIPALDLGNPMMDELGLELSETGYYKPDTTRKGGRRAMTVVLLPGSRSPEAYANWQYMRQAIAAVREEFADRPLLFLAAIAAGLDLETLGQDLAVYGWRPDAYRPILASDPTAQSFSLLNAKLVLTDRGFGECLRRADFALAMAGTATEQFVGLGKPAIVFPGTGPQFTRAFAEAQSRHLGCSLIVVDRPEKAAVPIRSLLRDPDRLQTIAENGRHRLGKPGAASRIAACLMKRMNG
jgi:uncharacterized protein (TIGR03492 family)